MAFFQSLVSLLGTVRTKGYFCNPEESYNCIRRDLPRFTCYENDKGIQIDFDTEHLEAVSSKISSVRANEAIKFSKLRTFQHDFTLGCISTMSDVDLNTVLPPRSMKETPDIVFRKERTLVVIEFCTTRSFREYSLRSEFLKKRLTYEKTLRDRLDQSIKEDYGVDRVEFYIIVVGPTGVCTNLMLPDEFMEDFVDELSWRLNISIAVLADLEASGLYEPTDTDLSSKLESVKSVFKSLNFDWETTERDFKPFSKEMYEAWLKPVSDEQEKWVNSKIEETFKNSAQRVLKKHKIKDEVVSTQFQENLIEAEQIVKLYKDENFTDTNCRSLADSKAIIQFPFWNVKESESNDIVYRDVGFKDDATHELWRNVFMEIYDGRVEGLIHDPEREMRLIMAEEKLPESESKMHRSKYHRVKYDLSYGSRIELAKVGFDGKKHSDDPSVAAHRIEKKRGFHINSSVEDLDFFFTTPSWMFQKQEEIQLRHSDVFCAITYANAVHNCEASEKFKSFVDRALETRLGWFLSLVSDIAVELSLSLKQHTKQNQVVVKKLMKHNLYILIKPTESSKHCFFSLLVFKEDLLYSNKSTVFKSWKENDQCVWTEFVSVKQSKLTNLIKAESTLMAILGHWTEFYSKPFWEINDLSDISLVSIHRMIALNIVTLLHDKHVAEEIMTLQRYIFMEGFVSFPCVPNPQKMVEKLPTVLRSRFEVWLVRKSLSNVVRVCKRPFKMTITSGKQLWTDLPNPFFDESLPSPYHLINCFYLGYLKNKEESAEANTLSKMYEKILEWEDNQPESDEFLGLRDPDNPKKHEFSSTMIKVATSIAMNKLEETHGRSIKSVIESEILGVLANQSIEDFCSLKASSTFTQTDLIADPTKEYKRKKVIENCKPYLDDMDPDESLVIHLMRRCLSELIGNKGLNIDLFRKPQHAGLREIYVLTLPSRVVQLILEGISRAICRLFSSETMTNPSSKQTIPRSHHQEAHKKGLVTISTSDDAAKWNQGHFVTKFAEMLVLMTPEYMHPFIIKACQLWMNKRILIDPKLIKILNSLHEEGETFLLRMASALKGKTSERWLSPNRAFIHTRSGMMQGILHYTSSLYHTIFSIFIKSLGHKYFKSKGFNTVIDHMQSSDDSTFLVSGRPIGNKEDWGTFTERHDTHSVKRFFSHSAIFFEFKDLFGLFFGIYMSVKRTANTAGVFEFNSEYYFGGNQYRPTFRWVSAALMISEQESIAARQEEAANLLKDCLEGGSSYSSNCFVQYAQAFLHYRLLGSSVNQNFKLYVSELSWSRDPALGFFMFDNPFMCGLAGFQYNLWKTCKETLLGGKYSLLLEKRELVPDKFGKIKNLEVTNSGAFIGTTCVRYGDRKKWKRLIDNFNPNYGEVIDEFNENPEPLYRRPQNKKEVLDKLTLKLLSPGVTQSLSKGNALPRIIASSVYILSREVVADSSQWYKEDDPQDFHKTCILRELSRTKGTWVKVPRKLTEEQVKALFPFYEDFEVLESICSGFTKIVGSVNREYPRSVRTSINIQEGGKAYLFSPDLLVANKWFGMGHIPAAQRVIDQEWQNLRKAFPWLSMDPRNSLENSPFSSHVQLQNFLARLDRKARVVRLTGVPIKSSGGHSSVFVSLVQGFFPGYTLDRTSSESISSEVRSLQHMLRLVWPFPFKEEKRDQRIKELLSACDIDIKPSMGSCRRNVLAVLSKFCKYTMRPSSVDYVSEILDLVYKVKMGIVGHWIKVQKYDDETQTYYGEGVWSGLMDNLLIKIKVKDDTVSKMTVSSESIFRRKIGLVKSFLKEMGFKVSETENQGRGLFFDGRGINSLGIGCRVEESRQDREYYDNKSIVDIDMSFSKRSYTIRLSAKYKNDSRRYTILSYSSKDKDICFGMPIKVIDTRVPMKILEKSWYEFQPLGGVVASRVVVADLTKSDLDENDFFPWVDEHLQRYIRSVSLEKKLKEENLPEVDMDAMFDDIGDFSFDVDTFQEEMAAAGMDDDMENFDFEGIKDLGLGEVFHRPKHDSFIHPLWSGFVNHWAALIGTKNLEKAYFGRTVPATVDGSSLAKILSKIQDVPLEEFTSESSKEPEVLIEEYI